MLSDQVNRHNDRNRFPKCLHQCCGATWPWFTIILSIALGGIGFGGYLSVKQQLDRIEGLGPLFCTYSGAYYNVRRDDDCFNLQFYTSWNVSLPLDNTNANAIAIVATSPLVLEVSCVPIVNRVYNDTEHLVTLSRQWRDNHVCWLDPDDKRVILFDLLDMEKTVRHWSIAMLFFLASWIVSICWACLWLAVKPRFSVWLYCGSVITSHPLKRRDASSSATAVTAALPITHALVNPQDVKTLVSNLVFSDPSVGRGGVSDSLTTLILMYANVLEDPRHDEENDDDVFTDNKDNKDNKYDKSPNIHGTSHSSSTNNRRLGGDGGNDNRERLTRTINIGRRDGDDVRDVWVIFQEPNGDWSDRRIQECRFDDNKGTRELTYIRIAAPTWIGYPSSTESIWVPTSSIYLSAIIQPPPVASPLPRPPAALVIHNDDDEAETKDNRGKEADEAKRSGTFISSFL